MSLTIREKADVVGTFRHLSILLMETLARWVPTTPEMEAKILFGRHIWELAQHADAFGKRTHELRAALHYTLAPTETYASLLATLVAQTDTGARITGFYDAALADLDARYAYYLADTHPLLDEPTVRVIERARADIVRLRTECGDTRRERADIVPANVHYASELAAQLAAVQGFDFVAFRAAAPTNLEIFA